MSVQSVAIRRLNKLVLPPTKVSSAENTFLYLKSHVATFNLNLQALGYTLSAAGMDALTHLSTPTSTKIMDEVISTLREITGVRNYKPMYPNFPQQVISSSEAELYFNAMMHYFSFRLVDLTGDPDKIFLPTYIKDQREPLTDKVELKVLRVAASHELTTLATRLATSNTSLSASDKEDLRVLAEAGYLPYAKVLEAGIPNKENLAFVGSLVLLSKFEEVDISLYFKTATDILRLATAMSNGDVSLSEDSKFKGFKRSDRKYLLSLLENIHDKEEDMLRWRERWVRLGERLHPGEFKKQFPTTTTAFHKLRNNEHIDTFRSKVEKLLLESNILQVSLLLMQRPGELARRLDHILRKVSPSSEQYLFTINRVLGHFESVAKEVSTPVLLQVMAHFQHREDMRVVFPKGNVAHVMSLNSPQVPIPEIAAIRVVRIIQDVLVSRFSQLPSLGKVYIDPALKGCLVPFSQRSASKTIRTLVRGSKIPFGLDKDTLRFFIWWKDMADGDRVDLDLSAVAYDSNWGILGAVTYYNLREGYAVHSGDITSAPNGASEFIDVDIPKAVKQGVRYIVMSVYGYTTQNFSDLPECFAGFMLRDEAQSGEVYDPRTVVEKADITMAAQDGVPLIIDLVDRKVIWVDAALMNTSVYGAHNVSNTKGSIELLGKAFTSLHKPDQYTLLSLHAQGRGTLVSSESEADMVFSVKVGTPFEIEKIASEFMA